MAILSYKFIADCPPGVLPTVLDLFTETALQVCEGQQYDMDFEKRTDISIDDYLRMIELKTSVLIASSLKLGAILGGASLTDTILLYEFGRNLGIAFQLRDDMLDVFGDTDKFGKKIGMDIIANKKTYLFLKAVEIAERETKDQLLQLFSTHDLDPEEKVSRVKTIFTQLGIKKITEDTSMDYFEQAVRKLDMVSVPEERKYMLKNFAEQLMEREQ